MKIQHKHLLTCESTSSYIKDNFDLVGDFSFVSTDYQFSGKGRNDRKWVSPIGENLLFSFSIKDPFLVARYADLSVASAYVIASYLKDKFGIECSFKWPNDVYVDNKKISGILLETHMKDEYIDGLIIGVGLNVNQILFNQEFITPATSIKCLKKIDIDIEKVRNELFVRFVSYFLALKDGDTKYIDFAKNNNYLLDKTVYIDIEEVETPVVVKDINDDGSLKILYQDEFYDIISGEISLSPKNN